MLVPLPSKSLRKFPKSIERIEVWRLSIALDGLTAVTEGTQSYLHILSQVLEPMQVGVGCGFHLPVELYPLNSRKTRLFQVSEVYDIIRIITTKL